MKTAIAAVLCMACVWVAVDAIPKSLRDIVKMADPVNVAQTGNDIFNETCFGSCFAFD